MTENKLNLEDELKVLDSMNELAEFEAILENETTETLDLTAKEIEKKKNFVSKKHIIEDESFPKPKTYTCCSKCSSGMWFGNTHVLKCYCNKMFTITYDSSNMQDVITGCDGSDGDD